MIKYFVVYDLNNEIIGYFENYDSLSKFFEKSVDSMQCSVSRFLNQEIDKIKSNYNFKYYKVYKFEDEV